MPPIPPFSRELDTRAVAASREFGRAACENLIGGALAREFAGDWVGLLEKNGEAAPGGPEAFAEFKELLPRIREGLEAFEEFDSMTLSQRREGGQLRTSLQFKTR